MAEKTIQVRIKNASMEGSEWTEKNPILLAGEIGIEKDTGKFKFGDGVTNWNDLEYAGMDIQQIKNLIDENEDNVYEVVADEEDDLGALSTVAQSPKKGDIGIVKRTIANDKLSYTAYIYSGSQWEAADGNYSAENVYFSTDMTITANIGVQTIGSSGSKTLSTTGKNVKQVFDLLVAEEKNPSITQPSVNISSSQVKAYEVGTNVTPSYNANLNPGNYQYGPSTGVTATSWSVTDGVEILTTSSGSFKQFQVIDNTSYKITATAQHSAGVNPKTNLGNDYAAGAIKAGSKNKSTGNITGYRNSFYGTVNSKDSVPSSAIIRTLTKSNKALTNGNTFNITIPINALRVIIAYPATLRDVSSILDVNGLNAEIKSGFTKQEVQVEGENGYNTIAYKVYTMDYAKPNDTANTYKVTI